MIIPVNSANNKATTRTHVRKKILHFCSFKNKIFKIIGINVFLPMIKKELQIDHEVGLQ